MTQQKWAPDGVYGRALGVARNSVENNFLIEPQALVLKEQMDERGSDVACEQTVRNGAKEVSRRSVKHRLLGPGGALP